MRILLDFTERLRHYEIPASVRDAAEYRALNEPYVWAHNLIQDLFSFEREAILGDVHNFVFVLERHRGLSREAALDETISVVRRQFADFVAAEGHLPTALDRLEIPLDDRRGLYEIVDDLRATFSATYIWCSTTSRYLSTAVTSERQPGFLGDVLCQSLSNERCNWG